MAFDAVTEEKRRLSFGAIADAYDRHRPGYPRACVDFLVERYGLGAGSKVLEIGCGTGKFTELLVGLGCEIEALDVSGEMLALARERYPGVVFHEVGFEDFEGQDGAYDFVLSATAFHWVGKEARELKTARLLKPGGVLAFLYNQYGENDFRRETQQVYERVLKMSERQVPLVDDKSEVIFGELQASALFKGALEAEFANDVDYDTEGYLANMATHSFQNTLPKAERAALFDGVREVLGRYGGRVTVPYVTKVFCLERV